MGERQDPLVGFHYAIDVQGKIRGYFTECSGIGSEHEVIEHKVIDEKSREIVMKVPGRLKWDWRDEVVQGHVDTARRNGSIIMFDQSLKEVARWNFERAWPVKVSGPSVKADSNEFAIEELVITHEYLYRAP
jgi:phage tail-like protein